MKLYQLSVFLQNRPGQLSDVCGLLARAEVSILTLSLADTEQFGILRLIVRDWLRARQILEADGCVVKVNEVVAVEIPHQAGGLAEVLAVLEEAEVNIEYMYAFTFRTDTSVIIVFRFEDPDGAVAILKKGGVSICQSDEVYRLADI